MDPKERILAKAEELFMRSGIRAVSMDDIATHLGMSKKTLYQFFEDKDQLVEAVVDLHIRMMEKDCQHCRREAKDAIHEIYNTLEMIMEQFSNMNPILLHDLEKFHFKSYQKFREHKDKFLYAVIRNNIEWGVREELYRNDFNVDAMTRFRLESMMMPFNVSVFPPGKYNLAQTSQMIIEHFTYGISTAKGYKLIQKYNQHRTKNLHHENR